MGQILGFQKILETHFVIYYYNVIYMINGKNYKTKSKS